MRQTLLRKSAVLLACLVFVTLAPVAASDAQAPTPLPNPVLFFVGQELHETGGKQYMRYRYNVENRGAYPNAMFAAAPDLPPCGKNASASRTWVDIYDQAGKRLNGFCAFGKSDDLNKIWFSLELNALPPSWVYIEMNDRKTSTKYKSNLAETVL